jgi:fibronectin-binding autotransporter adhesin
LAAVVVVLGLLPAVAQAATTTWVVTSTADGTGTCPDATNCTLRAAVADSSSGDTVQLTGGSTYSLDPTKGEISVGHDLTIAPASGSATVDFSSAPTNSRLFEISAGSVTISSVTISGGVITAPTGCSGSIEGGGVCVDTGATLDLTNSTVSSNQVSASGAVSGGGVSNHGTLNLDASTISSNEITSTANGGIGGGIASQGSVSITSGSNVTLNDVTAGGGAGGGAEAAGGGIALDASGKTLTVNGGSTVTSNRVAGGDNTTGSANGAGSGRGGGIFISAGTATVTGSGTQVGLNTAVGGNETTVTGGGGAGSGRGGGIDDEAGGTPSLTVGAGAEVGSNEADGGADLVAGGGGGSARGAGIYYNASSSSDTLVIDGASIDNQNVANGGTDEAGVGGGGSARGGGVDSESAGTLTIENGSVIDGNMAFGGDETGTSQVAGPARGGGVDDESGGTVDVNKSRVSNNSAGGGSGRTNPATVGGSSDGGGIDNFDGTVSVTDSTVVGNTSTAGRNTGGGQAGIGRGGGIDGNPSGAVPDTTTISASTIVGNGAEVTPYGTGSTGLGGGIYTGPAATVSLNGVTLNTNDAVTQGGSIMTDKAGSKGTTNIHNTILAGGTAPAGANCSGTGTLTDQGHNLDSGASCALSGPGDQSNTNPMLGGLGPNGGPTETEALPSNSPAVDRGDTSPHCTTTDQRGMPRPDAGESACDIGAYELQDASHKPSGGPAPKCTVTPSGRKVLLRKPKGKKGKHKKPGILTLRVKCNEGASVKLSGTVVEKLSKKHTKSFKLPSVSGNAHAATVLTLTVKLPKGALNGLRHKRKESVTFTLTATNTNGTGKATAKIGKLIGR